MSAPKLHWSSCAVNNGPALPVGPCDCGGYDPEKPTKPEAVELEEFEPNRFRVKKTRQNFARSKHPLPYVISDIMPPTEQVDGKFYTSKSAFRRVGKDNGLIEVGNEKLKPKTRATDDPQVKKHRTEAIRKAISEYRAGRRSNSQGNG